MQPYVYLTGEEPRQGDFYSRARLREQIRKKSP